MALPIKPNNPNTPIPNNPFYSPETTFFCGAYYPALITPTSGITVNANGTISVTGGGGSGGGVTALAAGPGIALSGSTGNVVVCTNIVAGTNIALTQSGNQIAISAIGLGTGTVTALAVGPGLNATSNPITTSGSISLNTACVIPPNAFNIKGNLLVGTGAGTYTAINPGVDGQVLMACAGSGAAGLCWANVGTVTSVSGVAPISVATGTTTPTISIASASTTGAGAVQLNNTLSSTSTTEALTAAQGKALQDQITALTTNPGIELAGTINANTGLVLSVTSVGSTAGYTVGASLPAASVTTKNTYVIVTEPGTLTPPGGSPTAATKGDWFLASQVSPGVYQWEFLNVGFDAPAASTTTAGLVELATSGETATGTDGTIAVTPAGASATYIAKSALTAKGDIISAIATSTPSILSVGADGCILTACSTAPTGLCWASAPITGIPCACITAKGSLVSGTAAATPTALPVGTDGQVLVACSTATTGLCWATPTPSGIPCACVVGKGAIITGTAGSAPAGLPVGLDGQVLTACSTASTGLCWVSAPAAAIPCACLTAKGQLITTSTPSTPVALNVGTDGQVLVACSAASTGLCWATIPLPVNATPTVFGLVKGCTDATNAALGCNALLTGGGANNIAIGLDAQRASTSSDNISLGTATLKSNTAGFQNVAVGHISMCSLTGANANQNVAVGSSTLCAFTSGLSNDAIGALALISFQSGCYNVSVGGYSSFCYVTGNFSTAIGHRALNLATGCCNTSLGAFAGENITTGCGNVAIGPYSHVSNPAGNNQLAIGYAAGANWLTGDSGRNIRPGAGIRDCAGNLGTSGQVLTSTGSAIQWANPASGKQYFYGAVGTTGVNVNTGVTLPLALLAASGISLFGGGVLLTVGKTYLLTASLMVTARNNIPIARWRTNAGDVGPEIWLEVANTLNSISWVYTATAGFETMQLRLAQGNATFRQEASIWTILEI